MANELDEMTGPVNQEGRDVNVIEKQIAPKKDAGALVLEIFLWILGLIGGIIFEICKKKAKQNLDALQQAIQHDASEIDNYLEQRVVILKNAAKLLDKAIDLDKDLLGKFANARGANALNEKGEALAKLEKLVNATFEHYPDIKAHQAIEDCMQQNSYLQREITAARTLYNDRVYQWNAEIFKWPVKKWVAAKAGYTTRIPFSVSSEIKAEARKEFF